ncbi:PAS domain-containing protein [Pseudoduganella sp. UC29_106]|uniref:PAS domain-containing protein n=1 Tax=Pseudoduganella sp. UC29_106 TaxID=3374553 RepID=UPI0037568FBB
MDRATANLDIVAEALQLIGMPACGCDAEGIVIASNPELDALLETDPRGRDIRDYFAPHVRLDAAAQLQSARKQWDSCLASASGAYISVQLTVKAVEEGGFTIVFHDISNAQRDQRALRKAMLEQQAILENAAVGIILSKGGVIVECNMRAAEMFGYARDEMEGAPSIIVYSSPEEGERLRAEGRQVLRQGRAHSVELQLRRRDGSLFWCRTHGRALDPTDTREGTVWIVEDIHEQRAASEATRQLLLEQKSHPGQRLGRHPVHQERHDVEL